MRRLQPSDAARPAGLYSVHVRVHVPVHGNFSASVYLPAIIAEHACRTYSGRVGRSAAAKALDEQAARLAVGAYIRHAETDYDELLMQGLLTISC